MATFLALCQKLARESGTISGALPTSVLDQSGRLLKVVNWVADAWTEIQNHRSSWAWMRAEFDGAIVAGSGTYTPASFGLTRFARWIVEAQAMSLYKTATGVSDERPLNGLAWSDFRRTYRRGTQLQNRPIAYAVSPASELCFGPLPDDDYTALGEYMKGPQTLAANTDEPEMPARFHDLIVWWALLKLSEHDEATPQALATAMRQKALLLDQLLRDQLPQMTVGGGPLA